MEIQPHLLVRSEDGSPPEQPTLLRLGWDEEALHVRFECRDRDAWGTHSLRDSPLYEEEVVEVFLAAGEEDPKRYFEIEVSPRGALFDAVIHNPTGRRAEMTADLAWDCPGLEWRTGRGLERQDWWAEIALPWRGLGLAQPLPHRFRANFYRIERPREPADAAPEYSALWPTYARPADFHRPERFGTLELAGLADAGSRR